MITLIFFILDDKLQVAATSSWSPRGWACKHYLPLGEHFQSQGNCTGCLVGGNVSPTISYLDWLKSLSDKLVNVCRYLLCNLLIQHIATIWVSLSQSGAMNRTCPRCVPLQLSCLVSGCVLVIFLHKSRAGKRLCYVKLPSYSNYVTVYGGQNF